MKKILFSILMLSVLTFTSCGGDDKSSNEDTNTIKPKPKPDEDKDDDEDPKPKPTACVCTVKVYDVGGTYSETYTKDVKITSGKCSDLNMTTTETEAGITVVVEVECK